MTLHPNAINVGYIKGDFSGLAGSSSSDRVGAGGGGGREVGHRLTCIVAIGRYHSKYRSLRKVKHILSSQGSERAKVNAGRWPSIWAKVSQKAASIVYGSIIERSIGLTVPSLDSP